MADQKTSFEIIGQKIWFKNEDQTWSCDLIDLVSTSKRRKKTGSSTPDQIISNMPGKVTKLFVNVGDTVTAAQPLLVLEAMKMEYTLKSDLSTTVENVLVKVGDQVTLGQLLLKLKKVDHVESK